MSEAIARLVELDEGGKPVRDHALGIGRQVIGRDADVEVSLDHRDVSRHHAELVLTREGGVVRDLGSKNGLRLDGVKIDEATLPHGAILALGELQLRIEHVGARVEQLLINSGELTVRRPPVVVAPEPATSSVVLPLAACVVFGLLLLALMVFG